MSLPIYCRHSIACDDPLCVSLQASYATIKTVPEFKEAQPVAFLQKYVAAPGERSYLVVFGNYGQGTPAKAKLLTHHNSGSKLDGSFTIMSVMICILSVVVFAL